MISVFVNMRLFRNCACISVHNLRSLNESRRIIKCKRSTLAGNSFEAGLAFDSCPTKCTSIVTCVQGKIDLDMHISYGRGYANMSLALKARPAPVEGPISIAQ